MHFNITRFPPKGKRPIQLFLPLVSDKDDGGRHKTPAMMKAFRGSFPRVWDTALFIG